MLFFLRPFLAIRATHIFQTTYLLFTIFRHKISLQSKYSHVIPSCSPSESPFNNSETPVKYRENPKELSCVRIWSGLRELSYQTREPLQKSEIEHHLSLCMSMSSSNPSFTILSLFSQICLRKSKILRRGLSFTIHVPFVALNELSMKQWPNLIHIWNARSKDISRSHSPFASWPLKLLFSYFHKIRFLLHVFQRQYFLDLHYQLFSMHPDESGLCFSQLWEQAIMNV